MAKATIYIGANTKNANKALDSTGKKVSNFSKATFKAGKTIVKSVTKMTAAFATMAIAVGKKSVDAFIKQENAEIRLETIAKNTIKATEEQIQAFKDQAAAMQEITTLGDEVVMAGQSQIASFTTSAKVVETLTGDIADLAVAQYGANVSSEQMIQSANMVGKALTGQLGAMTRAGVLVSDDLKKAFEEANTEEERAVIISQILADNYGGLAEAAAKTAQGGILQLKNSMSDMAEEVGGVLIPTLLEALPAIKEDITAALPDIKNIMGGLVGLFSGDELAGEQLSKGIVSLFKKITKGIKKAAPSVIKAFLSIAQEMLILIPEFIALGIELFTALLEGIAQMDLATIISDGVQKIVDALVNNYDKILKAGIQIALSLLIGILQSLPIIIDGIIEALPMIIDAFVEAIPLIIEALIVAAPDLIIAGIELIVALVEGIIEAYPQIIEAIANGITAGYEGIVEKWPEIKEKGAEVIDKIIEGITSKVEDVKTSVTDTVQAIKDTIADLWDDFVDIGKNIIDGIIQGITDKVQALKDTMTGIGEFLQKDIKEVLGIKSPSRVFADIGKNIMLGWQEGISNNANLLNNAMGSAVATMNQPLLAAAGATENTTNFNNYNNTEYNMGVSGSFIDKSATLELQRMLDDAKALEDKRRGE